MKLKKIQKEFLDLYYKGKTIAYEFDEENGKVYLTDTYRLYVINYEDFIFRFDLFRTASLKQFNIDEGYTEGIITNTIYSGDINTRLITNSDNTLNITINEKYLDLFDNPTVKIKSEDKPVLIYENDIFVGLVLPIRRY